MGEQSQEHTFNLAKTFVNALKNALKAALKPKSSKVRAGRLIRALFTSHYAFIQSKKSLTLQVNASFLSVNDEIVHRDRNGEELSNLASMLRGSGLRSIQFAPIAMDMEEFRSFVYLLANALQDESRARTLVNQLWTLDLTALSFRALDELDKNTWTLEDEELDRDRGLFSNQFLYRVSQTFSPHLVSARARQAKKSLEGNVSGDSLSMESHFNIVFGKRGSSENIDKDEVWGNSKPYEPVLVERLANSLRNGSQDFEDEEFRGMLAKQLSGHPPLANDQDLLRRSVAAARTLETSDPPKLTPEEAASFYLHVLRSGVAMGELQFLSEIFALVMSEETALTIIQAVDLVSVAFANRKDLETLFPLVEQSIRSSSLERSKKYLTEILMHLAPFPTLEALGLLYKDTRDDGTRLAFQDYFVKEGENAIPYLEPIFESKDETILTEAFGMLTLIGSSAYPILEAYSNHDNPQLSQLASRALSLSANSSQAFLRNQYMDSLESTDADKRYLSLEWLSSLGEDGAVFEVLETYVRSSDFEDRGSDEVDQFLKTLAIVGGNAALPILQEFQHFQSMKDRQGSGTRRIQDAAKKVLKELEDSESSSEDEPSS